MSESFGTWLHIGDVVSEIVEKAAQAYIAAETEETDEKEAA